MRLLLAVLLASTLIFIGCTTEIDNGDKLVKLKATVAQLQEVEKGKQENEIKKLKEREKSSKKLGPAVEPPEKENYNKQVAEAIIKNVSRLNDNQTNLPKAARPETQKPVATYSSFPSYSIASAVSSAQTSNIPVSQHLLPKCIDGTLEGSCSPNKPFFCQNNALVENSQKCGCPENYKVLNQTCEQIKNCNDGTAEGECSKAQPFYCDKGTLVKKASVCKCGENATITGEDCIRATKTCPDGTPALSCSREKPKYCEDGSLVEKPITCGCPNGFNLAGDKCEEKKCLDGTKYNQCSTQLPNYCNNGILLKNATFCGCPANHQIQGIECVEIVCLDGTKNNQCSMNKPKYCQNGALIDNAQACGCPINSEFSNNACIPKACPDGTKYGECSTNKPQFCEAGTIINKASTCNCPEGKTISGNECVEANRPFQTITLNEISSPTSGIYGYLEYLELNERKTVDISTNTNDAIIAVEIWSGFVEKSEQYWWTKHSQIAKSEFVKNSSIAASLEPSKYSIMYLHWPKVDGKPIDHQISKKLTAYETIKNVIVDFSTFPTDYLNGFTGKDQWEGLLNVAYEKEYDLSGGNPWAGTPIKIKHTSTPYCGLSGNPIQIGNPSNCIPYSEVNNGDPGWGPLHEIGHDFTQQFSYAWNGARAEAYASFFAFHIYDTNIFPQKSKYTRTYMDGHAQNYLSSTRNWQDVGTDEYIGLMLKLKDKYGWDLFKKFFRKYRTNDPYTTSDSDKEKLERQVVKYLSDSAEEISPGSGRSDVISTFQQWRFPTP